MELAVRVGAVPAEGGGFRFRVWAPRARRVKVDYVGTVRRHFPLARGERGYFEGHDPAAVAGDRYWLTVDGARLPDPASRWQPEGVRGPSCLLDLTQARSQRAPPRPVELGRAVLYEMHIGTFSPEGTFAGALPELAELAHLGVTAVELLPVEEERGGRGWGYGPVHQFAVRQAYGGPAGLLEFVAEAHAVGLSVLLDVVYNHWSAQAAFLEKFGPYFHPRAITPWGPTPNIDGSGSDEVRRYFFDNARLWLSEYGVDGFRLDAVHEIHDRSARPFWAEFSDECRAATAPEGRPPVLIAESDLNDVRILQPTSEGGWGLDAQWSDDFHHALHAAVTGERLGYYADYDGLEGLARAFERPFLYEGQYSVVRDRRYGAPARGAGPDRFVVFDQNHDQIGNRGDGARLTTLVGDRLARVALGLTLFSPYVPMLFMGEEYGEKRPFYFFADPPRGFARRVTTDRLRQLRSNGFADPPPDPSDPRTMERCRLDRSAARSPEGTEHRALVRELLRLRRELPALARPGSVRAIGWEASRRIAIRRDAGSASAALLANLADAPQRFPDLGWAGIWTERLDSGERTADAGTGSSRRVWTLQGGPSSREVRPRSFVLVERAGDDVSASVDAGAARTLATS